MENSNDTLLAEQLTQLSMKLSTISIDLVKLNSQLHLTLRSCLEKQHVSDSPTTYEKVYQSILEMLSQTDMVLQKKDCSVKELDDYYLIQDPN